MKKIINFLKENWIGALIGGLYFLAGLLTQNDYLRILVSPTYPILALLAFLPLNKVLSIMLSVVIGALSGAFSQKLIREKRYKTITLVLFLIFLLIIIFVGYGLFSDIRDIPNRCYFSQGLQCIDWQVSSKDGSLILRLRNTKPEEIFVNSINIKIYKKNIEIECHDLPNYPIKIESDKSSDFLFNNCQQIKEIKDYRERFLVDVNYSLESSPSNFNIANGEIFTIVIKE